MPPTSLEGNYACQTFTSTYEIFVRGDHLTILASSFEAEGVNLSSSFIPLTILILFIFNVSLLSTLVSLHQA